MINPKSFKAFIVAIILLTVLSGGMFIYQHFFYNKEVAAQRETVYVLNQDIKAHTQFSLSMVSPVEVYKDSVLPGMITATELNSYDGYYFKHGVSSTELLNPSQLSQTNLIDEGDLVIPIQASIVSDVYYGDNVGFYVLRKVAVAEGSKETRTVIEKVFDTKKLYGKGQTGKVETVTVNVADESIQFYIKVTEAEMELYYRAIASGSLILVKQLDEVDKLMDVYSNINYFDPESTRVSYDDSIISNGYSGLGTPEIGDDSAAEEEVAESGTNEIATVAYTVKEDDTWASIAEEFKTSAQVINALNPDVISLQVGTTLIVPAQ